VLLLSVLITQLVFCWWYVTTGYDTVASWFMGLNSCFYRSQYWQSDFFTPKVKATGNGYCFAALAVILMSISLLLRSLIKTIKSPQHFFKIQFTFTAILQVAICIIAPVLFWIWGISLAPPSNDEVFSAFKCADIHPFQTISYYMLPNNHILFNLLNNILFHAASDKTITGRFFSLLCYCSMVLLFFSLFKTLLKNSWLALIVALGMSIQFPVWAFGCQARGYELLTLCGWTMFISFFKYTLCHEKKWLYLMAAASAAAYFTVPTFMYMDAAVLFFALCIQIAAQSLCFSGIASITENQWTTNYQTYTELWNNLTLTCHEYMDYTFCNNGEGYYLISLALFLFPFTMILYRHNTIARMFGWFYLCMWALLIPITLIMRQYPIDRALQVQFIITYAFVIYSVYLALSLLAKKIKAFYVAPVGLVIFLLLMSVNYVQKGQLQITHYPCHFNSIDWNKYITEGVNTIPRGCSVALSDESCYWSYLCTVYGYDISKCPRGNEQYLVKGKSEPFFNGRESDFALIYTNEFYAVYKRK
jgi:hypothetical protein